MMLKYNVVVVLLIVLVFGTSCSKKKSGGDFIAVPIEHKTNSYSSDFYHVSVEYPVEQWDYDYEMMGYVEDVVAFYRRDWSPGGMHFEREMDDRRMKPDYKPEKFELNIRFEKFNSPDKQIHSYLFFVYTYTGGANGETSVATFNFDADGYIPFDDFFQLDARKEIQLTRILAEKASTMPDVFSPESVKNGLGLNYLLADEITIDTLKCKINSFEFKSNFSSFIIQDNGVHFYYDKYRLTPGSAGVPSIILNWNQLSPYISRAGFVN